VSYPFGLLMLDHLKIIMRRLLMSMLMMLGALSAWAQFTVVGTVRNASTFEVVSGANVVVEGENLGVSTNTNGEFKLQLLAGTYKLKITSVGYGDLIKSVTLTKDVILELMLTPSSLALEEVVVSATRANEIDPITVTNISREKIEGVYIGQDPSVLLEQAAPSIISYSDAGANIGNYVQFRMRGMDQTRINTTLNGIPLNDMIDQGVFFSNFSDFGNSLESIQVQRGVGATGNGTSSYAGSINFESRRLSNPKPSGEVQLLGGSFGTFRGAAEVSTGKLDNNLAFYARATRTVSDGFKYNSGSDSYSFFLSGGYFGDEDMLRVTAFMGKTENDQSYTPVLLSDIEADPRTNYNGANDTDNFEQELIQVQYARTLNGGWDLNASAYYGGARGVFPFSLSPTNQLMFGLQNDHYGILSDLQYTGGNIDFKAGIHAYRFDRENFNYTSPNVSNPDYVDETGKSEVSFFGKLNYQLGAFNLYGDLQLRSVSLGFQADEILSFGGPVPPGAIDESRSWFFVNPKIGLSYNVNNNSKLYASFGRTGREPTRTDILQGDGSSINEFNFFSVQDPDLVREEFVNDIEVGYELQGDRSALKVNYFLMDFENEISLVGGLSNNSYVPLRQNIANSTRTGVEIEGNYAFNPKLAFNLNATYMNTTVDEFDNGTDVFRNVEHIFAPDWIISPAVIWKPVDALAFNLNGRYVSESFMELSNDPAFILPSYFILNAQLDYAFNDTFSVTFMINNITDELYFNDGAPVDVDFDGTIDGPGYRVQPPRNFYGMLRIKF
jgi:iron complex outermembrane receptor protein